jgi:putative hydrolase of the HAD superfamily
MLSGKPLKAIFFDVGGPIVDESVENDRMIDLLAVILSEELKKSIPRDDVVREWDKAIRAWAPSCNRTVLWQYLRPDRKRFQSAYKEQSRRFFAGIVEATLMPGVIELIPRLADKYLLALAGNQHTAIRDKMISSGVLGFFKSTAVSEDLGFQKPDTRFFLAICDRIDVPAENCCMVGDRLDNDIYPANVLGMRTIWFKVGPHAVQTPRIPEDEPDETIESIIEIPDIVERWEKQAQP